MIRILLAVHPHLRALVLAPGALDRIAGVEIVVADDSLWSTGWHDDRDVEAVITGWGTPAIDAEALERMPRLRAILHIGGTVRELVASDVWARGIQVVSAAEANNESVADYVFAQTMLALKGTHRAAETMRAQRRIPGPMGGPGTLGQPIGLVSYGSIARKVRARLRVLDATVAAWDPFVEDETFHNDEVVRLDSPLEVFQRSAVVSLHAPLIPGQTEGMVTEELLSAMPHGATFINTARGALVDEHALVRVLSTRADLFAILDVTWPEPPGLGSALYELPNVLLTGHTAGSVGTENQRMGAYIARAVAALAEGADLPGTVSREASVHRA